MAGLARDPAVAGGAMLIFMFVMAGLPPAGRVLRQWLFVFSAAIEAHLYSLAIMGVLASAVSASITCASSR